MPRQILGIPDLRLLLPNSQTYRAHLLSFHLKSQKNPGDVVLSLTRLPPRSVRNSYKVGRCLEKNVPMCHATASLWFGLPKLVEKKIRAWSVLHDSLYLRLSNHSQECVICGNIYISEVDWAGRTTLVPYHSGSKQRKEDQGQNALSGVTPAPGSMTVCCAQVSKNFPFISQLQASSSKVPSSSLPPPKDVKKVRSDYSSSLLLTIVCAADCCRASRVCAPNCAMFSIVAAIPGIFQRSF